ncbi:MAG: Hsp20/alpha crystallin family protein [Bacteroidales bacterium]
MIARVHTKQVPAYWDDFFNDSFFNHVANPVCGTQAPATNVQEDERSFGIEMAVPGVPKDEIRLNVEDDLLTISYEARTEEASREEKAPTYRRREFVTASFKRSFRLGESVDQEAIEATQENGVLRITLPKKAEVIKEPKKIEIR